MGHDEYSVTLTSTYELLVLRSGQMSNDWGCYAHGNSELGGRVSRRTLVIFEQDGNNGIYNRDNKHQLLVQVADVDRCNINC